MRGAASVKIRLFHQLFALVAATAVLAVLARGALLSWNLTRGFAAYLTEQDERQRASFASEAARLLAEQGPPQTMLTGANPPGIRLLLSRLVPDGLMPVRPGLPGRPDQMASPPSGPPMGGPPPGRRPRPGLEQPARPLGPPPQRSNPGPPQKFSTRLLLFDSQGNQLAGPPPPPTPLAATMMLEAPITVRGDIVAVAKLLPRGVMVDPVDAGFLSRQYKTAAVLAGLLVIAAAAPAFVLARRGAKRLGHMQTATNAIAKGSFDVRVEVNGSDELATMAENINDMAASLEQLEAARRRWLAEIGHELRTPMTVLIGEIEALRDGIRPLTAAAVHSLSEEAGRLSLLIEDLQFLAMSDLTAAPCHFAETDAVRLVREVAARFSRDMEQAGLSLAVECGAIETLPVLWDRGRIDQVLANLLTNALRYTDAPGAVRLSLFEAANDVRLTLEDTAPAVPEAQLEQLFEPLFRLEGSRARASGGSGLGLAVSKSIVRAHGGTIRAQASELGGLAISLSLPKDARRAV